MTARARSATARVIELADVDKRHLVGDRALGIVNRLLLLALGGATVGFIVLAVSNSAMANALTPHAGPVYIEQRMSFVLAALITGSTFALLSQRLNNTWAWAKLPAEGSMRFSRKGVHLNHAGVLDREILVEWDNIKAVALDSGHNHDEGIAWRRFPLPSPNYDRRFLFDTGGEVRPEFALISGRPTAPNVAIIFHEPVALRNLNSQLTEVTFLARARSGLPSHPPTRHTAAAGVFLRTRNLRLARDAFLPSGKLRALRNDDVD